MNDGTLLGKESDASLRRVIALGGSGIGKSVMMPPYGQTLSQEEIDDVISYIRVIAAAEPPKTASNPKSSGE